MGGPTLTFFLSLLIFRYYASRRKGVGWYQGPARSRNWAYCWARDGEEPAGELALERDRVQALRCGSSRRAQQDEFGVQQERRRRRCEHYFGHARQGETACFGMP